MKAVSWGEAFRRLNLWRERGHMVSVGPVIEEEIEPHNEVTPIFWSNSGSRVLSADPSTGEVEMLGEGSFNFVGASFKLAGWEDSPVNEADLDPEQYESLLEITFPDGRVLVFAQEWPLR